MQETRDRNTDARHYFRRFMVDALSLLADIEGPQRKRAIDVQPQHVREAFLAFQFVDLLDEVFAIHEPDLADDNERVSRENDAERGDC